MKKVYSLLIAGTLTFGANAQTYFSDNFEGGSLTAYNAWTTQVVSDPDATGGDWALGTTGGNYARVTNYISSANHILNTWFITPSIDLSSATTPKLNFDMTKRYTGNDIVVHVSTNYDGVSAPSSATWTDITSLFTLDANTGSWTFVNSGNGDISAYISASTYIAFEYVGTATDGSTWEIDNVLISETGLASPAPHSIYEIQSTLIAGSDSSYYRDSSVITGGLVTAVRPDSRYYVQAGHGAWSGVYVYDNANTVAIGDSVTFEAVVAEYNGLTELKNVSNFNNFSSGNTIPQTIVTTAQSMTEDYEGVLVTMQNATCTQPTNQFGEWIIDDNSGPSLISDFMYAYTAPAGGPYEVTGIVDYSFGAYKVQPRFAADIVTNVTVPVKTIYEIQSNLIAGSDSSYYRDSLVSTGGIVTAIRPDKRFYIQAGSGAWSGVYVYDTTIVTLGDSVTFNCIVKEFNGVTELTTLSNLAIVNSGNAIPQTTVPSSAGTMEDYEGVLITVLTAQCTVATNSFGEWIINDGSGDCTVGDLMYPFSAVAGGTYTVTGILDYAFGAFYQQPRFANDIIDYTGIEENSLNVNIYPIPSNGTITIDAPGNSYVTLTDISGKVVYSTRVNTKNITLTDLSTGVYIAKVTLNGATATSKVIVK